MLLISYLNSHVRYILDIPNYMFISIMNPNKGLQSTHPTSSNTPLSITPLPNLSTLNTNLISLIYETIIQGRIIVYSIQGCITTPPPLILCATPNLSTLNTNLISLLRDNYTRSYNCLQYTRLYYDPPSTNSMCNP